MPLYLQNRSRARPDEHATEQATEQRADLARARDAERPGSETSQGTREYASERPSPNPATAQLTGDSGRPLHPATRARAESAFDRSFEDVRIHDSKESRFTTGALGARALADGANLWLGPGESEADWPLLSHELAHVDRGDAGVNLRSATWLERRAWLAFFDHYLSRKLLDNYMDDTGDPITLTVQEMADVNAPVDIERSADFQNELEQLKKQVAASTAGKRTAAVKSIAVKGPGQALTNGTLGNFTVKFQGLLTVTSDGSWVFSGTVTFYDYWDFDPKPFGQANRSTIGEIKTRVGDSLIPGEPFHIYSEAAPVVQSNGLPIAIWAGFNPLHVGDSSGRTGADIATGAEGGGVAGGPEGEAGGGETGAQSAGDLNR